MYKKHLSEKIARVFEITGYVQLIPAIPIVLISAIFIFPLLISVPVFGIGLTLFVGYIKHSRGNLDEGKVIVLWITTFIFNFLPLLYVATEYYSERDKLAESLNIFTNILIFWWIAACCLSLTAFYDEFIQSKY